MQLPSITCILLAFASLASCRALRPPAGPNRQYFEIPCLETHASNNLADNSANNTISCELTKPPPSQIHSSTTTLRSVQNSSLTSQSPNQSSSAIKKPTHPPLAPPPSSPPPRQRRIDPAVQTRISPGPSLASTTFRLSS